MTNLQKGLAVLAGLAVVYFLWVTTGNYFKPKLLVQTKPVATGLATEVKVIPVVTVKKSSTESRLRVVLPAGHSVTATAALKPSETGYEVLSVIDENTGVSELLQTEKPRSAFGFPMTGKVKAGVGIGTQGQAAKLGLEFTPLRVGALYVTAEAELRVRALAAPEAYTGLQVEYRF